MIGSIHVADAGLVPGVAFRPPKPSAVPGLLWANGGATSVLGPSALPELKPSRVGWAAMSDDNEALDGFLASGHPLVERFDSGWSCRLRPVRAYGAWPGLPEDLPRARRVETDGPVAVLTLARLRVRRAVEFFRTSAPAEATMAYAFDSANQAHADAIGANRRKPFHVRSAFVRFTPYDSTGRLAADPALAEDWLSRSR